MRDLSIKARGARPWSWTQLRKRTLAIYQAERQGRLRMAVLVWQADDPRVDVDGALPRLLALTMDLEPEPGRENVVALAGFESLEAGRDHCLDWTGGATEVSWDSLGETAQIGLYAAIRDPSFAERG